MVIIKANCPQCGEVDLKVDEIRLQLSSTGDHNAYLFMCPVCRDMVEKPADSRIVQLLISGGVTPELIGESQAVAGPAPFSYDDLLDFHLLLESEDELVRLLTHGNQGVPRR